MMSLDALIHWVVEYQQELLLGAGSFMLLIWSIAKWREDLLIKQMDDFLRPNKQDILLEKPPQKPLEKAELPSKTMSKVSDMAFKVAPPAPERPSALSQKIPGQPVISSGVIHKVPEKNQTQKPPLQPTNLDAEFDALLKEMAARNAGRKKN